MVAASRRLRDLQSSAVWFRRFSTDSATTLGFFKWAKSQTGYRHSPELYYLMVDVLGKCKSFDSMSELVEEMARLEGYVTLETMTKVMRRLARTRKHEDAIQAFRRMEKFGVKKDTTTLNVLIDALVKGDSVEHAHKVVLEFKGSGCSFVGYGATQEIGPFLVDTDGRGHKFNNFSWNKGTNTSGVYRCPKSCPITPLCRHASNIKVPTPVACSRRFSIEDQYYGGMKSLSEKVDALSQNLVRETSVLNNKEDTLRSEEANKANLVKNIEELKHSGKEKSSAVKKAEEGAADLKKKVDELTKSLEEHDKEYQVKA
ncbi:Pentatricopeptide repeat-containing protein, mitochondrial [Glycine soja]|nr:Pentatricopeptide repeat-containing protein, mitochondrial [Glycine soja]